MPSVYERNLLYEMGRKYILWIYKHYYDEIIVQGAENIPPEGVPVIYAPNHLNALMDSLAVLTLPPARKPKIYLSRADLFNLPAPIVKFIRFAKLIPAYRIRDGYENLGKNKESFEEADLALMNDACLVIMPEGNQGEEKRIRPLVKGIFRIAFSAQQKMPENKSVMIVPVGIDMGHLIKFGKHLIINIGKPISVSDYMLQYTDNQARAINTLRDHLKNSMEELVPVLGTDEYYKTYQTAVEVCQRNMLQIMELPDNTLNRFKAEKLLGEKLMTIEKEQPEKMERLRRVCKSYKKRLTKRNLRTENLEKPVPKAVNLLLSHLLTDLLMLVSLPGFLLNILPFKAPVLFPRLLGVEYKGFYSSVYYGASLVLYPIIYTLQAILLICLLALPWWTYFILMPLQYFTGKLAFYSYRKLKSHLADQRVYRLSKRKKDKFQDMQKLRSEIINILFD